MTYVATMSPVKTLMLEQLIVTKAYLNTDSHLDSMS